jgi:hypothetical protein
LHEALDHFECNLDRLKREVEIEIAALPRLTEIFKLQSDDMAAPN